jgi:hypothetical protein
MIDVATAYTDLRASADAGAALGEQLRASLRGEVPDAVVLFASSRYDYRPLLEALTEHCGPKALVGCSSAGEFTSRRLGEGAASAVALRSDEMQFSAVAASGLSTGHVAAAKRLVSGFQGRSLGSYRSRAALVLVDALAGHADALVEQLTVLTSGRYQFFGGGAGDDARFQRTHVFCGTEAMSDAVVALEILSNKPLGVGVRHGWRPASAPLRVTEAEGMRLVSLDGAPAVEAFREHAALTGQAFDERDPIPFFLHNVIGIATGEGYRLRVPLALEEDGAIVCAAEVPAGATVCLMGTTGTSAAEAAAQAARAACEQLGEHRPKLAFVFDCVATRLRLGREFGAELDAVRSVIDPASYVGFNTYGQIARSRGQFGGFHNCTAVACVLPE